MARDRTDMSGVGSAGFNSPAPATVKPGSAPEKAASRKSSSTLRADIRVIILAAFAALIINPGIARAQFAYWPQYGAWPGQYVPHRHKHSERRTSPESKNVQAETPPKGPLQIIISIADQRVSLYENAALIARSSVSTGMQHHPTPVGVFSVIGKQRWHRSNIYSGAPMPYMQRITWSGIALHAGVLPGYPASHGCIRMGNDFAIRLYRLTKRGTRVIISPDDVQPVEITNPHLFKPKPPSSDTQLAATAGSGDATAAGVQGSPVSTAGTQEAPSIRVSNPASATAAPRKPAPITIFISRKLGKLYVRQGFSPLFDVAVRIADPEAPLGTHVFTATELQNNGADIRWIVVSMPQELPRVISRSAKPREKGGRQIVEIPSSKPTPDRANAALDRIEIPPDAVDRISELLTPASSLIISDNPFSHETGEDTDFIVVMH